MGAGLPGAHRRYGTDGAALQVDQVHLQAKWRFQRELYGGLFAGRVGEQAHCFHVEPGFFDTGSLIIVAMNEEALVNEEIVNATHEDFVIGCLKGEV